ncbi:MAG: AI-2E family transporter, partial [Proteobacteria bacterium]|nr:AI-2E family transporter [Pseudomonadota bacterium]
EKIVMRDRSLLTELAATTPIVVLQIAYAGFLAFMLLAHRNSQRRQILRVAASFDTRVRLARVMRDINERVGHYLFSLTAIYFGVAVISTVALALMGFPNAIVWGACMGLASFVPFVGPPTVIGLVALVALLSFNDWKLVVAAPAILTVLHFAESQYVTPTFVSRRCALNTVAVFVTIALLGWMWGAIGAIVAVPLLILISTIAAHLPSLRWLEVLLSDDRPTSDRVVRPPLASVKPRTFKARPLDAQRRRRRVAAK